MLLFIETLEVKEVDLEREYNDFIETIDELHKGTLLTLAKHFFELGLRASLTEEKYIGNVKGSYTTTTELKA